MDDNGLIWRQRSGGAVFMGQSFFSSFIRYLKGNTQSFLGYFHLYTPSTHPQFFYQWWILRLCWRTLPLSPVRLHLIEPRS